MQAQIIASLTSNSKDFKKSITPALTEKSKRTIVPSEKKNLGFLMTKVDKRLKNTKEAKIFLSTQFGDEIFETSISTNAKFLSLPESQKTIFDVEKAKDKGFREYMEFSKEIIARSGEELQ